MILPYPTTFLQELLSGGNDNSNTQIEQQRAVFAALPEDARRAFALYDDDGSDEDGDTMLVMPFDIRVR